MTSGEKAESTLSVSIKWNVVSPYLPITIWKVSREGRYAKALAACNGTPEGIQAAYNTAEKEAKAAEDAYSAELKNVPGAKTANIISVIATFGMMFWFHYLL